MDLQRDDLGMTMGIFDNWKIDAITDIGIRLTTYQCNYLLQSLYGDLHCMGFITYPNFTILYGDLNLHGALTQSF